MKKTLLSLLVVTSFSTVAGTSTNSFNNEDKSIEDVFANIDSSSWAVNPEDHGMTVHEYINQEGIWFADNFARNFKLGLNNLHHFKELANKDTRWVVSPSIDHLYSMGVIDTSKPFTVVVPENDGKLVTLHLQDMNHTQPFYKVGAGTYEFTPEMFDTKYVLIGLRFATDGTKQNVKRITEELQPKVKIIGGGQDLEGLPKPNTEAMEAVRTALMPEYDKLNDTYDTVQYRAQDVTDWEKTTYTIAGAFGLSTADTAMYAPYALENAKGEQCYQATYEAPKLASDLGYYSITVYDSKGYLMSNENNIVSTNQGLTQNEDGTFTVVFGGSDCKKHADDNNVNFAHTPKDNWSFLLRVYQPNVESMKVYALPEIEAI